MFLLLVFLQLFILPSLSISFSQCKVHETANPLETRELYVATCDTRTEWRSFYAMKIWNVTGHDLRTKDGLNMKNVCYGENWGKFGFLTKPLLYLEYLKSLPQVTAKGGKVYTILMDSDTFWSAKSLQTIWDKFDCSRGQKDVVLSTEMSCWVGRYCTQEDLYRWYDLIPALRLNPARGLVNSALGSF